MSKTEITSLKVLIKDHIKIHGVPDEIKHGLATDVAKWVGDLVEQVAKDRGMVK